MINRILAKRIVPVVVIDQPDAAEALAEALLAGGLDVIEVTFRTAAAEEAIRRIAARFPQILLGAGTLLSVEQVRQARAAGAVFGVAPGLNKLVVRAAQGCGLLFAPGVMTATEVERALGLGCKLLKFFPAAAAGGPALLKALAGPYAHTGVKFIPTGGIHAGNLRDYLALPVVAAVGGSWMVDPKLIAAGDWAQVTARAAEAVAAAQG